MCVTSFLDAGASSGACHLVYDALPLLAPLLAAVAAHCFCSLLPNCDVMLVVVVVLSLMCVQGCRVCKCDDRDNNKGQSRATFWAGQTSTGILQNGTILTDQTLHLLRTHLLTPAPICTPCINVWQQE